MVVALKDDERLKKLDVRKNKISLDGIKELAISLRDNDSLEVLSIYFRNSFQGGGNILTHCLE